MELTIRLLVALALTWAIGFERELRGAAAGDRTFALVGMGSAVIGYLALNGAPNALAGVVTGVGFLGAGVIVHVSGGDSRRAPGLPSPAGEQNDEARTLPDDLVPDEDRTGIIRGVTTAATIYAAAAIGAAAGQGELGLAAGTTLACLTLLEIRHAPFLKMLDGRYWRQRWQLRAEDAADM